MSFRNPLFSGQKDSRTLRWTKSNDGASVSSHHLSGQPVKLSSYTVDPTAAYKNKSNMKSTVNASERLVTGILKELSDVSTPLKSAARGLTAALKYYHQRTVDRETIQSLIPRVEGLAESLSEPAPEGEIKEIWRRRELKDKLTATTLRDLEQLVERGNILSFLNNVQDGKRLNRLAQEIRGAMMDYQTALQEDIYCKNQQSINVTERSLLNDMQHVADAMYRCRNRQGCLKGTRKDVLLQIEQWSRDEKDPRIFWLNGLAGTGKSTIAQTFAEICFADGKLGASFFCSRDFEDRSSLRAIFPTLAFQLACQYPQFREQLLQVLKVNPSVVQGSLSYQFEQLIVRPFKETKIHTLIVIDALDECKDREPASALLSVLSHHVHEIPEVKFFITGRPEPPIREGFQHAPLHPITEVLKLHDVKRSSVDEDITLYFTILLTNIRNTCSDCRFPKEWPSSHDINLLCKKAGGLFIYASTVVKFVAQNYRPPTDGLDLILRSQSATHGGEIDLLYTQILELAFRYAEPGEQELCSRFRNTVGALLLGFHPLSKNTLFNLLRHSRMPSRTPYTLYLLRSLLNVPDNDDEHIQAFHKSFPDFLTDRTRCKDDRFFIDPAVYHEDILFSCLELMKKRLRKNICILDDYAVLDEVKNLSAYKNESIGSPLGYACQFWTRHLENIPGDGPHAQRVQKAMEEFFSKHLLHWIEVLSVTGHLGGALHAINRVRKWYTSAGISNCEQADDGERLILEHFDAIRCSPSHIYHSALPLSPSSSWIHNCYKGEAAREVRVLAGFTDQWDTCSRTIHLEGLPTAFAHSGDTIAVGLRCDVMLLDMVTGSRTSVLRSHSNTMAPFALSLDGNLFVTGSDDNTVNLWDTQTGGIIGTLYNFSCVSAAISLNNATIALGTKDGAIRIWDPRTGKCQFIEQPHGGKVTAIAFSPTNSRHLVSSSTDGTVGQWDVYGHKVRTFNHGDGVQDVAYALDGTRFISCTKEVATIRDSESGAKVVELDVPKGEELYRCCFSPDGRFVACSGFKTVFVWAITNLEARLIKHLVGHSDFITFIAFSSSLISASLDQTAKFWPIYGFLKDSATTNDIGALRGSTTLASVKMFPDYNTIVTSDNTGEVKTWDLITGRFKSSFSTPASGEQDTHLAGDTLTIVWYEQDNYRIWDMYKRQFRKANSSFDIVYDLKISEDGSKLFVLGDEYIEVMAMDTGEGIGRVECQSGSSLFTCGSRVGVLPDRSRGWDFRGLEVPEFGEFPHRLRLDLVNHSILPSWIEDTVKGRRVFQLPDRYFNKNMRFSWDGRYLLTWSSSGDVMVIDFDCVSPR